LVSAHEANGNIEVFVVSDRTKPVAAQLNFNLLDFEGNRLQSQRRDIELAPLTSRAYLTVPRKSLLAGKDPRAVFLLMEVFVDGRRLSSNKRFFEPYKALSLPRPQIQTDVKSVRGGFRITLSADKFARAVYLSAPGHEGFFSDNYFDLIPGEKVEVEFRTKAAVEPGEFREFRNKLKIRTMTDAF
jgi:beta-mannosidase